MGTWAEICTVLGTIVTTLVAIAGGLSWFVRHMDRKMAALNSGLTAEIKNLNGRFDKQDDKLEKFTDKIDARSIKSDTRMDGHARRMDELYTTMMSFLRDKQ